MGAASPQACAHPARLAGERNKLGARGAQVSDPVFERYKEALKQGHVAALAGRSKEALARYEEAAKLADHRALPYVSMGSVLLRMGRPREALEAYDRAIARGPEELAAHKGRVAALTALGRRADADAARAEIVRIEALTAERRSRQDAEAVEAARGAGPEGLLGAALDAVRAKDGRGAVTRLVAAAQGYLAAGQLDAALDVCQRAVVLAPGSPTVHLAMVRCYLAREWPQRAVERLVLLDDLLTLQPDDVARATLLTICRQLAAIDPRLAAIAGGSGEASAQRATIGP